MAKGSMPQAVHNGVLIPASACAAVGVLRGAPRESRLQKSSGAAADTAICTWRAVVPSALAPLGSVPRAPATGAKKAGAVTVLVRVPEYSPGVREPKLYLFKAMVCVATASA